MPRLTWLRVGAAGVSENGVLALARMCPWLAYVGVGSTSLRLRASRLLVGLAGCCRLLWCLEVLVERVTVGTDAVVVLARGCTELVAVNVPLQGIIIFIYICIYIYVSGSRLLGPPPPPQGSRVGSDSSRELASRLSPHFPRDGSHSFFPEHLHASWQQRRSSKGSRKAVWMPTIKNSKHAI